MPVTVYRSSDAGAPTLTGQSGSLVTVLDAVLVNGYGAKAAAGWTKPFSGVNKAVYRPGAGVQHYFRVQDDAPVVANEARLRGFESMTGVDTGTGDFPTSAQLASGVIIRKSATADATARAWVAVADARTCYLFVLTGDLASTYYAVAFGEFYSVLAGDLYRSFVAGRHLENNSTGTAESLDRLSTIGSAVNGHYVPRTYTGLGTAVQVGKHGDGVKGSTSFLVGSVPFLNGPDGGLYMSPVWVHESSAHVRGRLRGFWHFLHAAASVADGDTWSGVGPLGGKTFLVVKATGNGNVYVLETSDTWETN